MIDSFVKTVKSVKYYGRYMDDMFIISHDKEYLKELLEEVKARLSELKLEVNEKKTHITKLSHGFTYLQIKYHVDNGKIIKRPTHNKVSRERKRLRKFKKKYESGDLSELKIHNCYLSWRNGVLKDCNACDRTIESIDRLYEELFPEHEIYKRPTRDELINQAYKELYEDEGLEGFKQIVDFGTD